jgi:hypothetical protein
MGPCLDFVQCSIYLKYLVREHCHEMGKMEDVLNFLVKGLPHEIEFGSK